MPIVQEKTVERPGLEGRISGDVEDEEQSIVHGGTGKYFYFLLYYPKMHVIHNIERTTTEENTNNRN